MNKRRRYKAHRARRARKVARRVSDTMKARGHCSGRVDVGRANRQFERLFPRAYDGRGGGPHGSDWP